MVEGGDAALLQLTARYDATERAPTALRVEPGEAAAALAALEPELREALEIAAANIRAVAEAQLGRGDPRRAAPGPDGERARSRRSAPPASTRRAAAPPTPPAS